ncbi:MAG: translation elongation factor 4 [Chloroflexi bacterium]|nr:translation elongation factor 4 [Chloroflexota bacterium]MCZ6707380.1 translation elongation factor 4 [Chloroflexota bacterium]
MSIDPTNSDPTSQARTRNFAIIAHIDHGKSTLSDRLMEATGTVEPRQMSAQLLDSMDLEREKGITIKARAVHMRHEALDGTTYDLNLVDTPGHVDFSYEVSRTLAASEGALLVVDAAEGIQAQTLANVYLALELDLTILPVVNKIDLPVARPEAVARELSEVVGFAESEVLFVSAKTGEGVDELLEAIVARIPPPAGQADGPARALIFDSEYDSYKGVIAYVRVMDGRFEGAKPLRLIKSGQRIEPMELGVFSPGLTPTGLLETGAVGYIATGLKDVAEVRVGDTVTTWAQPAQAPLTGYQEPKSMVFAGLYPTNAADYSELTDALEKLRLSDASIHFEPESSAALGFGYRMGFLGLLHMEIVQERLEREYGLELIFTAPSVAYELETTDGETRIVENPAALPDATRIAELREPWVEISVIAPNRYVGAVMETVTGRRGRFRRQEYLERGEVDARSDRLRVLLEYDIPLGEILTDFYDELKSRTQGFASLDYHLKGYEAANVVRLEILVNGEPVDALSMIVHRDQAQVQGRKLVERLRSLIPRQMFDVPIQAAIGSKIIARETVKALRKNVLSKCYGGDVSRKRKLLAKQAAGKKRLKRVGNVEIPQEAFMAVLDVSKSAEAASKR